MDRCKKTEQICRQVEFIEERQDQAGRTAEALVKNSPPDRKRDRQMGETVLKGLKAPADRKGVNCYGRTGDVSIALECGGKETILTTDRSYEVIWTCAWPRSPSDRAHGLLARLRRLDL